MKGTIDMDGNPFHVAHVIGTLRTGGAERQLVNYLLAADKSTFRHSVVCLTGRGELADLVEEAGVPVVVMPVRWRHGVRCLRDFSSWMKACGVSVVHTHMHSAALWGRLAGRLAGVPAMLTTEHGKELWKNSFQVALDRFLSGWTAKHIAVSEDGRRIRMEREKVPAGRITVIPNGVALPKTPRDPAMAQGIRDEFGLAPDQPLIGTVGRVVEAKGYPDLVRALMQLKDRHPGLHWLQVGEGPGTDELHGLINDAGLTDAVTMAGNRSDVPDILAALDVWVMSSHREGLSVALLEAMAAALPIVATNVGGMPDAIDDHESGLLVPSQDPEALAEGISAMLSDRDKARRYGDSARRRVERDYAIDAVARRIEAEYFVALGIESAGGCQ